jgi:hypothetical protein
MNYFERLKPEIGVMVGEYLPLSPCSIFYVKHARAKASLSPDDQSPRVAMLASRLKDLGGCFTFFNVTITALLLS